MALQVAVGAVVADDLEGVGRGLERPSGPLAAIAAGPGPLGQRRRAARRVEPGDARPHSASPRAARGPERVRQHPRLAVGVEVDEPHARPGGPPRTSARPRRSARPAAVRSPAARYSPVAHPAVGAVDARQEGRDHLAQLARASRARTRGPRAAGARRMPDQHRLVGLPRGVDADVGGRRGGQETAQQVEGPGADRAVAGRRRGGVVARHAGADVGHQLAAAGGRSRRTPRRSPARTRGRARGAPSRRSAGGSGSDRPGGR